jgi:hypothetical protein
MPKVRASIFDDTGEPELDVSSFAPKTFTDPKGPAAEQVRAVAKGSRFVSRQAPVLEPEVQAKRPARQYRTGRNVQFNVKALHQTVETFHSISDEQGWVLGYTLERAVEALQRELKKPA